MKLFFACMICFIPAALLAQDENKIIIGKADHVYSNILQENRKIWVHVPPENTDPATNIFSKQRYPVIYLLDGWEDNFSVVSSIVGQLGGGFGNLDFPQMMVVGIPHTDRTAELTPTKSLSMPMMDSMSASRSGGGEKFLSFIEEELIPHIDSIYPAAPYRVLIGHSLGGLLSIYALLNHTNLFNAYIAIDPSTIWDDNLILKQAHDILAKENFENRSLFLAIANTMNSGIDTGIIGLHMRANFALRDEINQYQKNKLISASKYYPDYDHGSVPLIAEYDALKSIFAFYRFNFPFDKFFNPQYNADTLLEMHYKNISSRMGYVIYPPEQFVNTLAYQLMSMQQFERALYFFSLNMKNYPQSANTYDSIGDYYITIGNKQKAIEYFSKALTIQELPGTRDKLEKLKAEK